MRDIILRELKSNDHVSGQQLARKLGISRTAIWKHINELRRMGYDIESHPHNGYRFVASTDMLVPEEITQHIGNCTIGKHISYHTEVTSTQDIASKLARDGAEEGTCVIAEKQTLGRGRKGRNWASPFKDGIYISIILRPNLKPVHIIQIPLVAGVALVKAIEQTTKLTPGIKWPNDIFIGGRKVAGILTEVNCDIDTVHYVILGIGINVNTDTSVLPEQIKGIATSLSQECGHNVSRAKFTGQLLLEMEKVYAQYVANGFGALRKQWTKHNITLGSKVKVNDGQNEVLGTALEIDNDGFLIIETQDGQKQRIISADVSLQIKE